MRGQSDKSYMMHNYVINCSNHVQKDVSHSTPILNTVVDTKPIIPSILIKYVVFKSHTRYTIVESVTSFLNAGERNKCDKE